ncbi:MAG: VOC family protein [Acidimicrobiales bacterium]
MKLTRLGHVLLAIGDPEKTRAFYCDVLGLQVRERRKSGGMVLALGQHGHDMETIPAGDHHVPEELQGEKLLQLAFQVDNEDDLRDAYFGLIDAGVEVEFAMDHGTTKSVYVKDPDGTLVEIYCDVPNALDIYRERLESGLVGVPKTPIVFER